MAVKILLLSLLTTTLVECHLFYYEVESSHPDGMEAELRSYGLGAWVLNEGQPIPQNSKRMTTVLYNVTTTITADQYALDDAAIKENMYWKAGLAKRLSSSDYQLPAYLFVGNNTGAFVTLVETEIPKLQDRMDRMSLADLRDYFSNLISLMKSLEEKGAVFFKLSEEHLGVNPNSNVQPIILTIAFLCRFDAECYVTSYPDPENPSGEPISSTADALTFTAIDEQHFPGEGGGDSQPPPITREPMKGLIKVVAKKEWNIQLINKLVESSPLGSLMSKSESRNAASGETAPNKKSLSRMNSWEGLRRALEGPNTLPKEKNRSLLKRIFSTENSEPTPSLKKYFA